MHSPTPREDPGDEHERDERPAAGVVFGHPSEFGRTWEDSMVPEKTNGTGIVTYIVTHCDTHENYSM